MLIIPLTGLITKIDFSNLYFVLKGSVDEGTPADVQLLTEISDLLKNGARGEA